MELSERIRNFLFLGVCLPIRLALSVLAYYFFSRWLGVMALFPVIGWLFFFRYKQRGFFGGVSWWANLRLLHSLNYFLFAVFSFLGYRWSYLFLIFDVIVGLIGFFFKDRL